MTIAMEKPEPRSGEAVSAEIRALLLEARTLIPSLPADTLPSRDVHDGLRIIAAVCSMKMIVPKDSKVKDLRPTLERLRAIVERITSLCQGRLPERRTWVFQNAVAMATDGISALVPPLPRAALQKPPTSQLAKQILAFAGSPVAIVQPGE